MRLGYFMMPLHPPGSDLAETLEHDLRQVERLDRLGFSEAYIGEHFTAEWENIPAPDLFIAAALQRTERIKLATELGRTDTGKTLYLLDEPTTGLHFDDVRKLLHVTNRLVNLGNTVIVIEHNLDVMKSADWLIDLGPEGGAAGGYVLAEGPPEAIAEQPDNETGRFLRTALQAKK